MAKYTKRAVRMILDMLRSDSYTVAEICERVRITPRTYYDWQNDHDDFAQAVQDAKAHRMGVFVQAAKKSLLKKIEGYTVQEKQTTLVGFKEADDETGEVNPRIKEQKVIDKYVPPDTAALIFTLTNGDPETWRNRQFAEVTGRDGKDLFGRMTDAELDKKIAELERRLT